MDFERLEVWRRASRLCVDVIKQVDGLTLFGFRDQICRSALSVPSNIAEGMERAFPKDKAKFLGYARGSCGELRTQLYIASELGFVSEKTANSAVAETKEISAMLSGLIKKIQRDCGISEEEPIPYVRTESN